VSVLRCICHKQDFDLQYLCSISQKRIDTVAINPSGEWLAFGCSKLGQLLVWEWQSESYVLKQQGHQHDMTSLAYSQDGQFIVTGGDDGKLKLWNTQTGFCFVTFTEHTAGIQAVEFSPKGQVVFSASLDGTVRAFDMIRYRNFRTFTSPTPVQFSCLAVDPSGEVVCAGSVDTFEIFVWSVQTGKLLDILAGHKGPISSLVFSPTEGRLVSGSWDKTIRTWDIFGRSINPEPFEHGTEVLALAYRPDGRQVAVSTLDGQITLWDVENGRQTGVIDGRRDIAGGRKSNDRRTAENSLSGKNFESICYTVDGSCIIAGGNSKWVCIYDISSSLLLKKFQISHNLSLDGMHEKLDSRNMTEAGPKDMIDDTGDLSDIEDRIDKSIPGAQRGDLSVRTNTKLEARTTCVRFSPTGRTWSAASTEGLLLYSLDDSIMFDPFDLEIDITPQSIMEVLEEQKDYLRALVMSFRLGEKPFSEKVLDSIPSSEITITVKSLPQKYLERLLLLLAERMEASQKIHFNLLWSLAVLKSHGQFLKDRSQEYGGVLRALIKGINKSYGVLSKV
jgi:periodic tryptophan protein 2